MKRLVACLLIICVTFWLVAQQNPSYRSFDTNDFYTNAVPWPIAIQSNLVVNNLTVVSNAYFGNTVIVSNTASFLSNVTFHSDIYVSNQIVVQGIPLNPQTLWLPTLDYELWYDPFAGRDLGVGAVGQMGWTSVNLGSGTINVSNAVNHFGTIAMTTTATSNGGMFIHLSSTPVLKPVIPPLDNFAGWTNRVVWRLNGTNAVRGYVVFTAGTFTSTLDMTNAIGIAIHSMTNTSLMGYCAGASAVSTTNLGGGTIVSERWYTNYIWCRTPGVISFNVNGGPEATLNANIPTVGLTPSIGFKKFAATVSSMEVDDWLLVIKRQ